MDRRDPSAPAPDGPSPAASTERLGLAASALRILAALKAGVLAVSLLARALGAPAARSAAAELALGAGWVAALCWAAAGLARGQRATAAAALLVFYGIVEVATHTVALRALGPRPDAWTAYAGLGVLLVAYLFACSAVLRALRAGGSADQGTTSAPP